MNTSAGINISSVILGVSPANAPEVGANLAAIAGVEVHVVADDGRMIVTIETDTEGSTAKTFETISRLPGVLSASLVYHQYETDPDEEA